MWWLECANIIEAIIVFWASALCVVENDHLTAGILAAFGVLCLVCYVVIKFFKERSVEEDISDLEKELEKLKNDIKKEDDI